MRIFAFLQDENGLRIRGFSVKYAVLGALHGLGAPHDELDELLRVLRLHVRVEPYRLHLRRDGHLLQAPDGFEAGELPVVHVDGRAGTRTLLRDYVEQHHRVVHAGVDP